MNLRNFKLGMEIPFVLQENEVDFVELSKYRIFENTP